MNNEEFRYLFLVRQNFGEDPEVDSFYKLISPSGMSGDEIKAWTTLTPGWEQDSFKADTHAFTGMDMRIRANGNSMYGKICLVRTTAELTAEDLEIYIQSKHKAGELTEFLEESAV